MSKRLRVKSECSHDHTNEQIDPARRRALMQMSAGAAALTGAAVFGGNAMAAGNAAKMDGDAPMTGEGMMGGDAMAAGRAARPEYEDPEKGGLPAGEFEIDLANTGLVVTDPQIDFLSQDGVAWGVVGESVTEQKTVDHLEQLFKAAKAVKMPVFISPHYYFPHDQKWKFEGVLEKLMHAIHMFDRAGPLNVDGFDGSGSDWMPQFKQYIEDGETIVCSPHKIYGPEQNDLVLQLRKRGVNKVILAGMSANLCVQAHLYELIEQGFDMAVVRDATAGAQVPEGDGYLAALINYRFVASAVWYTDDAVKKIHAAAAS